MIITDGSSTFSAKSYETDDFIQLEKNTVTSAGGLKRSQTSGARFKTKETLLLDGKKWRELVNLLTNDSDEYFYTPEKIPTHLVQLDFPMKVNIEVPKKKKQTYEGSETLYTITLKIEGAGYI